MLCVRTDSMCVNIVTISSHRNTRCKMLSLISDTLSRLRAKFLVLPEVSELRSDWAFTGILPYQNLSGILFITHAGSKKKVSLLGQIPWPFGWCFVLETWRIRGIIFLSARCVLVSVNIGGADRKHREQAVILLRNKDKSCLFESHFIMQGFKHKNSREWYSQLLYS